MAITRRGTDYHLDDLGRYVCPRSCGYTSVNKAAVQRHFYERKCQK